MKTVFIYALKEPDTGEIRYVGKASDPDERIKKHLDRSKHKTNHRECWIFSLVERGLKPELEVLDEVPENLWESAECGYIHFYRSSGARLVNESPGGDGYNRSGRKNSRESNEKNRLAHTGKTHSKETKEKISQSKTNPSQETRERMSKSAKIRSEREFQNRMLSEMWR